MGANMNACIDRQSSDSRADKGSNISRGLSLSRSIPPPGAPPPQETTGRALFICGGVGCIINIVASLLYFLTMLSAFFQLYLPSYTVINLVAYILFGVGIILASIGYLGMRRYYGSGLGLASFILGIITAVGFLVSSPIGIMFEQLNLSYNSGISLAIQLVWIAILNIFYVALILWGVTHIMNRRSTGKSGLSITTGIFCILTAIFMAASDTILAVGLGLNATNSFYNFTFNYTVIYVLDSIWCLLLVTAEILAAILFFSARTARFRHDESQQVVQTPQ